MKSDLRSKIEATPESVTRVGEALLAVLEVCEESEKNKPESPMGSGYAIACRSIMYRIERAMGA
jgi:hypothetical protein